MTVLVGGVGQLYQGDLDIGRRAVDALAEMSLGPDVVVEELHYGAIAVVQRLEDLDPDELIIVGAAQRGENPGSVWRRRVHQLQLPTDRVAESVRDAVTGYVTIDLLVEVASGLGALSGRTVAIEVEPLWTEASSDLSPAGAAALDVAVRMVAREVELVPLFDLVDRLRELTGRGGFGPAPALQTARELLGELETFDEAGCWGATFALRDRLRDRIARGHAPQGMDHLDWGLLWALIEELDRCQQWEITG